MSRLDLHDDLISFLPNVYFQPPSNIQMKYPCIIYHKTGKERRYANNGLYFNRQEYQLTVIENDPDSLVADNLESFFEYCTIDQYFTVDNLNHTTLTLYF